MMYSFCESHAIRYGVDEAIMIQNLSFWIRKNKANKKHFYDGKYWTYNSTDAFTSLFKFWTPKQLRRIMESLVEQGVIIRGNYNKSKMDRTGWYAFNDEDAFLGDIDFTKRENGIAEKVKAIPYINTDNKHTSSKEEDLLLPFSNLNIEFINQFNNLRGTNFKISDKISRQLKARIKQGFTLKQIIYSLENAMKDQYHIDNDFNHLTPEFITRPEKLDKYLNYKPKVKKEPATLNF